MCSLFFHLGGRVVLLYHTLTEAVAIYLRSKGIPMAVYVWIDDMFVMTQLAYKKGTDEEQFQSAMRSMVVTTWVLFLAG